jgi:hypothetical protein
LKNMATLPKKANLVQRRKENQGGVHVLKNESEGEGEL